MKRISARILTWTVVAGVLWSAASLQAQERKGSAAKGKKITGIVTAKTDKDIMVKAEGEGHAERYLLAPPGGKPSADVQSALKMVFVTNLVVLQWKGDDQRQLTGIQPLHSKTRFGMTAGTVVATESAEKMPSFDVKPNGRGATERYVPRWDPAAKGWDKRLLQIIAGLNVGDKVKVAWSYDERKRATQIQVVRKSRAAATSKKIEE
jgi:hypothetical protein